MIYENITSFLGGMVLGGILIVGAVYYQHHFIVHDHETESFNVQSVEIIHDIDRIPSKG